MMQTPLLSEVSTETVELYFAAGLPGFPSARHFSLTPWGNSESPFLLMSSLDDPDTGFVVISPFVFYPEYEFELDGSTEARLGLTEPSDAIVLCIVTLQDRPEDATVNLLGPIVINRVTHEACQAVLSNGEHHVRAPLARAA
jgi:flagellar assembly factor FliW